MQIISRDMATSNESTRPFGNFLRCLLCKTDFQSDRKWEMHVKRKCPVKFPCICRICDARFETDDALIDHLVEHERAGSQHLAAEADAAKKQA